MDTIFALASARGKAGVSVVRISGPRAWHAVAAMAPLPSPRIAALRRLRLGDDLLDEALVLTFEAGASYTGELSAELHLHGATATVAVVLRALSSMEGLRLAEAGEFTRRALENGRLDLTQAEGLSDLIAAETEAQRRQALRVASGEIGTRAEGWRRDLVRAAALFAAGIDFADEDLPGDLIAEVADLIGGVLVALEREISGYAAAERIREGFEVAIVGRPNAGKSTLLNALAGRQAAITSEHAGTTRDVIEVRLDLEGLAVTFLDTAGLRESVDPIERIGIDRALSRATAADLRVFLVDEESVPMLETLPGDIVVRGKADLQPAGEGSGVSGLTGAGVGALLARVSYELSQRVSGAALITRERHRAALALAVRALESALNEVRSPLVRVELAAEDLARAIRALEMLVGRIDVEDLLDQIFAQFCIGK